MKTNPELWQKLETMRFEEDDIPFGFAKRLARDNGWTLSFSEEVIEEYKKFVYLATVAGHEVTPSDEVDQVWHLHLTYTHHYWGLFTEILGKPLHHDPTQGTDNDKVRFDNNYIRTKDSYKVEFGVSPPEAIWPSAEIRFGDAPYYQRINTKKSIVLPAPTGLFETVAHSKRLVGIGSILFLAAASSTVAYATNASNTSPPEGDWFRFVILFFIVFFTLLVAEIILRQAFGKRSASRKSSKSSGGGGCSGISPTDTDGGGGGSGCGGGGGGG